MLLADSGKRGGLIFAIADIFAARLSVDVRGLVFVGSGFGETRGGARAGINGRVGGW